jgi:chlorite dismutase
MSDMVKNILVALAFLVLTFLAYRECEKSRVWNEEMTKRFYEALKKRNENLDDDLSSNYKYRDITEDAEVLLSDWGRVGEDIQYAMSEMDKELADKDNKENEE